MKREGKKKKCRLNEYCGRSGLDISCYDCKYKEELLRGYIALYKKKIRENLRERKKNM
jgi:hypothetical protein